MTNRKKYKNFKKSQKIDTYANGYMRRMYDKWIFWSYVDEVFSRRFNIIFK